MRISVGTRGETVDESALGSDATGHRTADPITGLPVDQTQDFSGHGTDGISREGESGIAGTANTTGTGGTGQYGNPL